MSVDIDLIRGLGRACALLAGPTKLAGPELKEVQNYAQRLGAMCGYYADNPLSQTEGVAGSIRAEISILNKILSDNGPNRRGRPKKIDVSFYDALFVLPVYNRFKGSRPNAVRHLIDSGLIKLKKDEAIETRVKALNDLNRRSDKNSR